MQRVTTKFNILLSSSCLSQREAAEYLNISTSSVDKMNRGKNPAPDGVIELLIELIRKQHNAAHHQLDIIEQSDVDLVHINAPSDDDEARAMGWPCLNAWKGMAAILVAWSPTPVKIVPRGTTLAGAKAADLNDLEIGVKKTDR